MNAPTAFGAVASQAVELRLLSGRDEILAANKVFTTAMLGLPDFVRLTPDRVERVYQPGRTWGAFVDGRLVGTTDSYSSTLTVPGGRRLPHAAVTHVGVLPGHVRRGIASSLIARQLARAREAGEVVATLRASDARIYERFGFGVAGVSASFELLRGKARLRPGVVRGGPVRITDLDESAALLPAIYDRHRPRRPGTIDRPSYWWEIRAARYREATGYIALHGPEGAETGYVQYHGLDPEGWFGGTGRRVVVDDLVAADAATETALIAHLASLDLVDEILFPGLPTDSVLPWLFEDHRAVRLTGQRDETWLRLLDIPKALAARRWGHGSVVLGVADPLLPRNAGRYRIRADGAAPTTDEADAQVDAAALAAAYLGGASWRQLAAAGRVALARPDALAVLDTLFRTERAPFAGTSF